MGGLKRMSNVASQPPDPSLEAAFANEFKASGTRQLWPTPRHADEPDHALLRQPTRECVPQFEFLLVSACSSGGSDDHVSSRTDCKSFRVSRLSSLIFALTAWPPLATLYALPPSIVIHIQASALQNRHLPQSAIRGPKKSPNAIEKAKTSATQEANTTSVCIANATLASGEVCCWRSWNVN